MVPLKGKPVAPVPNTGLAGVEKLGAEVAAAAPKAKGTGAGFEFGANDALTPPKVNGFTGAEVELKVNCAAGTSNDGLPKVNVD